MSSVQHAVRGASPQDRPSWLSFVTVDVIIDAAYKTVLHPFVAWMMPLSLRAITMPYSHPSFQLTTAYACFLTVCYLFSVWSSNYAFGTPREMDFEDEVVVITGGSSGLGLAIADFYRMRGAMVAVLDVQGISEDDESGINYYACDVSDAAQIQKTAQSIKKDVRMTLICEYWLTSTAWNTNDIDQ
jgi:NADPH:quinone reductase-like Zn-dependent oxidoreductase